MKNSPQNSAAGTARREPRPPADAALTDVFLFRVCHHNGLGSGTDDRWSVNSIFQLLLALTQPVASFFAAFLHFPVTGISRLVG
jgi:hypothetical protein